MPPRRRWAACCGAVRAHSRMPIAIQLAPRRAQGLEPRALGRRQLIRPIARRLATGGTFGIAAAARRDAAAGAGRGRPAAHRRRPSPMPRGARTGWGWMPSNCMPRTATCCTSSCRRSPTSAATPTAASLANRMRFPLQVFEAVRAAVPGRLPVGVRLSATDWVDGGWDLAQSRGFAQALQARGCSFHPCVQRRRVAAAEDPARPRLPGGPGRTVEARDRRCRPSRWA